MDLGFGKRIQRSQTYSKGAEICLPCRQEILRAVQGLLLCRSDLGGPAECELMGTGKCWVFLALERHKKERDNRGVSDPETAGPPGEESGHVGNT